MRIDRNAQATNRTRRDWQRLNIGTATTAIALNPSVNNALISTNAGYGVFVDGSTIIFNGSTISTRTVLPLASTGDLLTIGSTGSTTRLPHGATYTILTTVPSTASSTDLAWQSTLTGSTGVISIDFYRLRRLISSTNIGVLDWNKCETGDLNGVLSEDWNLRALYDANATPVVSWGAYQLNDSFNVIAMTWDNPRQLYDGFGLTAFDFANRQGYDTTGTTIALDWNRRQLQNSSGSTVLDWNSTTLYSSTHSTIWNWSSSYSSSLFLASPSTTAGLIRPRTLVSTDIPALAYIPASTLTATGQLITRGSTGATTVVPIGTNGQVLTVSSTSSTDLVWSTLSGGGGSLPIISTGDLLTIDSTGAQVRLPVVQPYYVLTSLPSTVSSTDLGWNNTLFDVNGSTSVDYTNRVLKDQGGTIAIQFSSTARALVDNTSHTALDYQNRQLFASTGHLVWGWQTVIATGDLLVGNNVNTLAQLSIGSSGQVLTVVPSSATSTSWVTPSTNVFPVTGGDPTGITAGQAWFNSTLSTAKYYAGSDGTNSTTEYFVGTLFATGQFNSVSGSTTAIEISPTLRYIAPAGFLNISTRHLRARLCGSVIATGLANAFTMNLVIGSTSTNLLWQTGGIGLGTTYQYITEMDIVVRTTGAAANVVFFAQTNFITNAVPGTAVTYQNSNAAVVDLTKSTLFTFTASTSTTNANDSINIGSYSLELLS